MLDTTSRSTLWMVLPQQPGGLQRAWDSNHSDLTCMAKCFINNGVPCQVLAVLADARERYSSRSFWS